MIREAILRAISHTFIISMLIVIPTVLPLYLITGFVSSQLTDKTN